jgi:cellobiose dehydrogenase (acceptor)
MSEAGKKTLLLEQGGPSYYITGGRERPDWLSGTNLSRVDVPGLYKSIYSNPSDKLLCNSTVLNGYGACTVGGNTAINAGLFFQPPASDFDTYFPENWKSKDVANATAKVRAKQPFTNNPSKDGKYYLQSGYNAAKEWLVKGAGYADVAFNSVPNNKTRVFGHPEFNYVNGQRNGPVKTYLQSALKRSNFQFRTGAQVLRVERNGKQATGVVVQANGQESTIKLANGGRVVISGGALFSPGLLMKSGIGPSTELSKLSKTGLLKLAPSSWINNTAVGDKLFDNPNTFIELSGSSINSYTYNYTSPKQADKQLYLSSRSGPYTFASETSAFWDVININNTITGVQGTIDSSGFGEFMGSDTITLNVYGTSGIRSTGRITVNATTGAPGPEKPFFYTDKNDMDSLAIATFIHQIFAALKKSNSGLTPRNISPDASVADIQKYITSKTQYTGGNVNHWSSSCRLGSCVDNNTKIKGMNNLFVVDASIVAPLTTNPVAGIMIAAERSVELILAMDKKY